MRQSRRSELARARRDRARQGRVQEAVERFKTALPGNFPKRLWALNKIRSHCRPMAEADRLIEWFAGRGVEVREAAGPDFSDVQELHVKLIRRDAVVDTPQAAVLARMDRLIATGAMDRARFQKMAAMVLGMTPALPASYRRALATELVGRFPPLP